MGIKCPTAPRSRDKARKNELLDIPMTWDINTSCRSATAAVSAHLAVCVPKDRQNLSKIHERSVRQARPANPFGKNMIALMIGAPI